MWAKRSVMLWKLWNIFRTASSMIESFLQAEIAHIVRAEFVAEEA
jgi:hypothetical protein